MDFVLLPGVVKQGALISKCATITLTARSMGRPGFERGTTTIWMYEKKIAASILFGLYRPLTQKVRGAGSPPRSGDQQQNTLLNAYIIFYPNV